MLRLRASAAGGGMQFNNHHMEEVHGLWLPDFAEGGSNLREAQAQANHLLGDVRAGRHGGCEVWGLTDNSVWSAV